MLLFIELSRLAVSSSSLSLPPLMVHLSVRSFVRSSTHQKDMSAAEIAREDEEERIRELKAAEERRRQEEQELLRRLAEAKARARADSADIYRGNTATSMTVMNDVICI